MRSLFDEIIESENLFISDIAKEFLKELKESWKYIGNSYEFLLQDWKIKIRNLYDDVVFEMDFNYLKDKFDEKVRFK